jgi:hypothetical protein
MSVAIGCSDEEINLQKLFLPQLLNKTAVFQTQTTSTYNTQNACNPLTILCSLFKGLLILMIIQLW